ncbi:MAG TPA: LON peptidase substrate-binding domain-containing protein [Burkholderiaceae bacterium]|nr:LON peptidase substrate-binding domain-containing protein [Burkholderiaceae bacterium]
MDIPLFLLNTVLFPGGALPLRIFETRYMDMARGCLRTGTPFGVCLIARGQEVGEAAEPETVGCLATIDLWDMPQLGLLHVRARGGARFRVQATTRQPDGLLRGEVELIEDDDDCPIGEQHQPCAELLQRIIDDLEMKVGARDEDAGSGILDGMPFLEPYRLESSTWVGNRLCEVLPIPLKARQKLMELDDARTRLDIVSQYLRQHAVIK